MNISRRPKAVVDIEDAFVYIGERNLEAGLRFLSAVEKSIQFLVRSPFIGSPRGQFTSRLHNLRQWPVKDFESYLIFYQPTDDGIEILRLLHGRRDIESEFADDAEYEQ